MQKYIQYVTEFHEGNELWLKFVNKQLPKYLEKNTENQTEIEHILDYLYNNQHVDTSQIWYKTISKKAEKWTKKLMENADTSDEVQWKDYEVVHDFWDGYKFVKLISEKSYQREWKLMSHCVWSYYWKDKDIYSLRDKKNNPHCTIEKDNQIKGKGNSSIHPKYIDYVCVFIDDILWMKIRESEMKNLWYIYIPEPFRDICESELYKWKYFYWFIKDCKFKYDVFDLHKAINDHWYFLLNVHFQNSNVINMWKLKHIWGAAYFNNSQITDLWQLQSIWKYACFRGSQVKDLWQLQSIWKFADFESWSEVETLLRERSLI